MRIERRLQHWFVKHIKDNGCPYFLDKNQAKIVLDSHKNTLVTARAGSGKTRTIVAKIIYLLTHEKISPNEIIVFAFNKKACQEINERLTKISYNNQLLFSTPPAIATTFHAFAYEILGGKKKLENSLEVSSPDSQFIIRAEQQFFQDYQQLFAKIQQVKNLANQKVLFQEYQKMQNYHKLLEKEHKLNFNQLIATAATELKNKQVTSFRHIFIDEYQDFSLLFLTLIRALRKTCPDSRLLAVGDDWQAINRFAGSDVKYFLHFEKYFPEDYAKLFIPTNYRSGKKIVKNANYFMAKSIKDYAGCKSKNKTKSKIIAGNVKDYQKIVPQIIRDNPGKTIKILSRNNDLRYHHLSLEEFKKNLIESLPNDHGRVSFSTIHKSKGLESDVVILLEIDAEKFPGPDKTNGLYEIFGDTKQTLFADESRLFYVALTRAKEKLYILSKNTKITKQNQKLNFFSYLNPDYLDPLL